MSYLISILISSLIGLEREKAHKSMGVRSSIIVCCTITCISILSQHLYASFTTDIARLPSYCLGGIGFIGSGFIRGKAQVQGVTTAATLLALTAIGMCSGFHLYQDAVILGGITLISLSLGRFKK